MSNEITKTRWERGTDAFLGQVVYIRHLSTWESEKWAGFTKEQRDYVAHLTNVDAKYGYERRFLKKSRQGDVLVPAERLANPVIEVRVGGDREYFRCEDGGLVRLNEGDVRAAIAGWRFSTGQPLHNEEEP